MDDRPCRLCGAAVPVLLDLGELPFANRFASTPAVDAVWPRRFGACPACGLAQLVGPAPAALLRPRVGWLRAKEPEGHLDALAARLLAEGGATVAGVSAKDDSLLERLAGGDRALAWRLDPQRHLGLGAGAAGVESVQEALAAGGLATWPPPADVVVARHILEHAHDPGALLAALAALCAPGGRLLIEVPACEPELDSCDYARLWEEHAQYFTAATLEACLRRASWSPVWSERCRQGGEELLVVLARRQEVAPPAPATPGPELTRAQRFAAAFPAVRSGVQARVAERRRRGPVALLGAGHLGFTWSNAMGVGAAIDLLLDDQAEKQGCHLPGLRPAVAPGTALAGSGCALCLLAVPPDIEERVIARHPGQDPAIFRSIFPASARHLLRDGIRP